MIESSSKRNAFVVKCVFVFWVKNYMSYLDKDPAEVGFFLLFNYTKLFRNLLRTWTVEHYGKKNTKKKTFKQ